MRSKALFVLNIAAITSLPTEQFTEVEVRVAAKSLEVYNLQNFIVIVFYNKCLNYLSYVIEFNSC